MEYQPVDRVPNWEAGAWPQTRERWENEGCESRSYHWNWFSRETALGMDPREFIPFDGKVNDVMEFQAEVLIESARSFLKATTVEYICLNEDMAMKSGLLISLDLYREFIFPRMRRVIEFYKSNGVRYVCVDTDGNPEALIPMMMDTGVDALWPLERSADQDPIRLRKTFGRSLRLWGGVDKRELAGGPKAIDAHLRTFIPLIGEGGFIPTVDHTVPPDVSWDDFRCYMAAKVKLLRGEL